MSENDSSDEPGDDFARSGQSGLSLPREDAENRTARSRSRRGAGIHERFRQAGGMSEHAAARWLVPAAVVVILLLVVTIVMELSQRGTVAALEDRVATLQQELEAASGNDARAEIERMARRLEGLGERLDTVDELQAELQALRTALTQQQETITALTGRLDELEQASSGSGGADQSANAPAPEPAQTSDASGAGEWVVNLITVADRSSAENVQKQLAELNVSARIDSISRDDKSLYRVVVPGFPSRDAAQTAAPGLKQDLDLADDPWITRQ